jgi:hypothetical protein
MSTSEKLSNISIDLYKKDYKNCTKEERDVVFKIYLEKYATKVM